MNHNHQIDSEHSDSINESRVYKISHTRRWIEFSIVIIVVAVLAIIVIPTITTISKSADYSTAYTRNCGWLQECIRACHEFHKAG